MGFIHTSAAIAATKNRKRPQAPSPSPVKRKRNRRKRGLATLTQLAIVLLGSMIAIAGVLGLTILVASGSSDPVETTVKVYLILGLAIACWNMVSP